MKAASIYAQFGVTIIKSSLRSRLSRMISCNSRFSVRWGRNNPEICVPAYIFVSVLLNSETKRGSTRVESRSRRLHEYLVLRPRVGYGIRGEPPKMCVKRRWCVTHFCYSTGGRVSQKYVKGWWMTQMCYQIGKSDPEKYVPRGKVRNALCVPKVDDILRDILKSKFLYQQRSRIYMASRLESKLSLKYLSLRPH